MSVSRLSMLGALVVSSVVAPGCALVQANDDSGLYGARADVLNTVAKVKTSGALQLIGSRSIRLPSRALTSISAYEFQYPEACGAYVFRVLEAASVQILEYSYLREDGTVFVIRDYVAGPSPFIAPGLWTSYDHTSSDIPDMMARYIETTAAVGPRMYSAGPVTGLAVMTQEELGLAYGNALHNASLCAPG